MLTVQVSYKNSTDDHWDSVANYQTRRGANNFISKNKALYPADIFNIRIIGEEKAKPEFLNCSQATKIGDVFVEKHKNDWDDTVLYDAYVVVGFTSSGKSVRVKKLAKVEDVCKKIKGDLVIRKIKFVKPSDEFMKDNKSIKTVRLPANCEGDIFFYVDFIEIASLDKNFNYDNVYVEGGYE